MKYPVGIQTFEQIINEDYVYVDKTDLIYSLVTKGKVYFLSRPRRFGKSLLISTLENYFQGHKNLFKNLKIEQLETNWIVYPVFHIDFNGVDYTLANALENKLEGYMSEWEKKYDVVSGIDTNLGSRFSKILEAASLQTGHSAVVLIDEYDKPLLDILRYSKELEERNRNILKGFYSVFKYADKYLRFVFLTGVTKFSQVSVFSGFNQPLDISMSKEYETLCGITTDELYTYFTDSICELAEEEKCTEVEIKQTLKERYDGYHFSERMTDLYNPFSILSAFRLKSVRDYWFATGTPTYLIRLLADYGKGINQLTGNYYGEDEFINYKADKEYPLPMLFQSGYLTIKAYDKRRRRFLLDFPNNEVKSGFLAMAASSYLKTTRDTRNTAQDMAFALEDGNLELFRKLLTSFLADIPYTMRRKENEREKERYFHYTFYLILRLMSVYTVYTEKQQSEGRVDCIVKTSHHIYIFEFKLDGTADEALHQIEEKGYAKPYLNDSRTVYKVGVSFSSVTGTVEDWKMEKK